MGSGGDFLADSGRGGVAMVAGDMDKRVGSNLATRFDLKAGAGGSLSASLRHGGWWLLAEAGEGDGALTRRPCGTVTTVVNLIQTQISNEFKLSSNFDHSKKDLPKP
jgi:hypothetical protein